MDKREQRTLRDEAIAKATNASSTPFDYIVIGSGAGGGPRAAPRGHSAGGGGGREAAGGAPEAHKKNQRFKNRLILTCE